MGQPDVSSLFADILLYAAYTAIGCFYPALLKEGWTFWTSGARGIGARRLVAAVALAAVNYLVFLVLLRGAPVSVVFTIASALVMAASGIVAMRRFGERLGPHHWTGVALVAAGCALVQIG